MTEPRLLTVTEGGQPRAAALRRLVERVAALGWLDRAAGRAVVHVGCRGRSGLAVATAHALAAALRNRAPSARLEMLDSVEQGGEWDEFPRLGVDHNDTVEVRGPRGVAVNVPSLWFEPFFLITVAGVHPDRRWRIGGVLQAQAELLAHLNPGAPSAVLLSEAHRLGASDLAVACGTDEARGAWWVVSPSDVLVEGSVAQAAGLDPHDLPAIRTIARHELLDAWDSASGIGDLTGVRRGAVAASLLAARERGTAAARRVLEDAGLISRNMRKVPQALRRRLAARAGGRTSA